MRRFAPRISVKAVLLGAATDIVATNVAMVPVAVAVFAALDHPALARTEQNAALASAFTNNPRVYFAAMILGCAASVLGGWVAARVARHAALLHGALSAVACVGFGVYGMIKLPTAVPVWQHIAFFVLSPALGAFGGVVWQRRIRRLPADSSSTELQTPPLHLRGIDRGVFVVNRIVLVVAAFVFMFFGLIGLYGYAQHQAAVVMGSAVISGVGLATSLCLLAGARLLRRGHRRHWAFHGAALLAASVPLLLIIIAGASRHAR
jgi:hypothetical protein